MGNRVSKVNQGIKEGKMKIESGICKVCGAKIHLTKHYGWLHDRETKDILPHRALPDNQDAT